MNQDRERPSKRPGIAYRREINSPSGLLHGFPIAPFKFPDVRYEFRCSGIKIPCSNLQGNLPKSPGNSGTFRAQADRMWNKTATIPCFLRLIREFQARAVRMRLPPPASRQRSSGPYGEPREIRTCARLPRSREGTGERSYRPVLALFADFSPRRGDAGP